VKRGDGVSNDLLLAAALELMRQNGKPLTKSPGFGRSMRYSLPNGESVRIRTSNDHILIVLADQPSGNAKLNIEGTNWLLIAMPEVERTPGKIRAYLLPTKVAVDAARKTHQDWLATNPNTKGNNTTWNLWFCADGPAKANNFDTYWKQYLLKGDADVKPDVTMETDGSVKSEVEAARQRISKAAGVPATSVRITIDFSLS
jgi:hypothetical protein